MRTIIFILMMLALSSGAPALAQWFMPTMQSYTPPSPPTCNSMDFSQACNTALLGAV